MYVHKACNMTHQNELAQAGAFVPQKTARQIRKTISLLKKMMKKIQGQFSRFSEIHRKHVEQMMLLCNELLTVNVHLYLKSSC